MKVLVVDDHKLVRSGISNYLSESQPDISVTECDSYESADAALQDDTFDVSVIDIGLPDRSGIQLAERCLDIQPECKIVILTGSIDAESIRAALELSVCGYLLKTIDMPELALVLRLVQRGLHVYDGQVADTLRAEPQTRGDNKGILTRQQLRLAKLLSEGKTNKEIAREMNISEKTVRNYLANVFDRLNAQRRSEVAVWYTRNYDNN